MWKSVTDHMHYILAGSPETPQILLHQFAQSDEQAVRAKVAENPFSAPRTLVRLIDDNATAVRVALTHNPLLPRMFLEQLSYDTNVDVRYALAENPCVPKAILHRLTEDENPYVADRAERTLARIEEHAEQLREQLEKIAELPKAEPVPMAVNWEPAFSLTHKVARLHTIAEPRGCAC